ncbi:MAG: L-threonylcarbamoyladenylate synthase [Pyrinomonadaceae bacterium]
MKTLLTNDPAVAADFIKLGGIAAFPTETVYGLGANVFDERAIAKIFEAKRRPGDNPLIAHIGSLDQIGELVLEVPDTARRFIEECFPGPLTLVLKKSDRVPLIATAGLDTIGVRMPGNNIANEFLKSCGVPIVAPSANISGTPSPTTWEAVFDDLNGRIDCILRGEETVIGLESTVVDCTSGDPIVLRSGAVSIESLREIIPSTRSRASGENEISRSPGMKHKHYAPNAKVLIAGPGFEIPDTGSNAFIGLELPAGKPTMVKICDSVEDYAHSVFAFFRECDKKNLATIYCQPVAELGIGAALMDRLRRAESR